MWFFPTAGSSRGLIAPLEERFDAPETDASADPVGEGGGAPDTDAAADAADDDARSAASADEDDEDDDDADLRLSEQDRTVERERFERVAKKLQKLNRRDKKFAPTRQRLRELQDAGLTLDDLLVAQRNLATLERTIAGNPRLKAAIYGTGSDAEEDVPDSRSARRDPDDEEFDESKLPFDPNENDANRYFANLARQNHDLQRQMKQLSERINGVDGRDRARTEAAVRSEWKSAIDGAADQIKDKGVRTLFRDAVTAAYQNRARHGLPPQRIIAHYLKELGVNAQDASRANAAAAAVSTRPANGQVGAQAQRQRIAENNRNLPRTNAATQGSPTTARRTTEKVADVSRRLRQGLSAR